MNVHLRARLVIRPNKPAVRILAAFSQSTCTIVSSSQLIHDPLVSLIDFFCFCAQADCKLTIRFSSLFSHPPHHLAGLQPTIILALIERRVFSFSYVAAGNTVMSYGRWTTAGNIAIAEFTFRQGRSQQMKLPRSALCHNVVSSTYDKTIFAH